jgi:RND superfamily putative drug exporter
VPASVAIIGDMVWWPSKLAKRRATAEQERELERV